MSTLYDLGQPLDLAADETTQVEISPELGVPGHFKLYVHRNGITIVRICKLRPEQLLLAGFETIKGRRDRE